MAGGLKVHPSLVLIGAIVGVQLFGFIGIVIAAPIMASFKLAFKYVISKLTDEDPWEQIDLREPKKDVKLFPRIKAFWRFIKEWSQKKWRQLQKKEIVPESVRSNDKEESDQSNNGE